MSSHELGVEDPDQPSEPARPRAHPRLRAGAVLVLLPLLVLGLVVSGYLAFRLQHPNDEPFNPASGATALPSDHDRARATATAQQFALRMDNINGTKYDAYVKSIEQLLSTKAKTKNKAVFATMSKTYAAAKIQGTGKVLLSGITDLDADSATVLVAHDSSVKSTQGSVVHHYRWTVDLVKVDGKWLVDDFSPVN